MPDERAANDYVLIPKNHRFKKLSVSKDGLSDHRALSVEIELD
jgi:endonuclease/exonuclease/phosphatase family metal-dependent hydrolase